MRRRIFFWCACAMLAAGAIGSAAASLRIVPIVRDDRVIVTVELADVYTGDVRQAIASGLRTSVTFDVELRMDVPGWVDRTIATAVVNTIDDYDNLTRRHSLSRMIDGRVEEALVTDSEEAVRKWLTTLSGFVLCSTSKLDPHRDYYVRISARVRPTGGSLIGWANAITNQTKFTFTP